MKYSITATLLVLLCIALSDTALGRVSPLPIPASEREYCALKESGRYFEALSFLETTIASIPEENYLEITIFRIHELCDLPELVPRGRDILESMVKLPAVRQSQLLRDRVDLVRAELALRTGDLSFAKGIVESFSFFCFDIIGPFKNISNADFERPTDIEKNHRIAQRVPGKFEDVSWYGGTQSPSGSTDMNALMPDEKDVLYYFRRSFVIDAAGDYLVKLGKTGFVDLWIDGQKIYSDRNQHGFAFDQYTIPVNLSRGDHRILIKMGDSPHGVECAVRIADTAGGRVNVQSSSGTPENGNDLPSSVRGSQWSDIIQKYRSDLSRDDARFYAGYLALRAKIYCTTKELGPFFSSISKNSPYHSSALLYLGNTETVDEQKGHLYKMACSANPQNAEAMFALATLKIRHRFFHEAMETIRTLKENRNHTYLHDLAYLRLCEGMSWIDEGLKTARTLKNTAYPTWGRYYEAKINFKKGDIKSALHNYSALLESDRMDRTFLLRTVQCHERIGAPDRSSALLHASLNYFPADMAIRLKLAQIAEMQQGYSFALGHLSSAARLSPCNKKVIAALGILYHKSGNRAQALVHLGRAVKLDPENFNLRRYLEYIENKPAAGDRLALRPDLSELQARAARYRDESTVVLMDETIYNVLSDGSFEKRIHRILKLNDAKSLEEFKNYYIVYEPEFESIDNIECVHYRDGVPYRLMESFKKNLTDHRNRLYYKTEVLIIPVTASAPGSVIDISYVIKNRGGMDFKNYFAEKLFIGGSHRILHQRILLRHPAVMKIHCRLRGVPASAHSVSREERYVVHHLDISNTPPYTREGLMPDPSTFLPSVCFTTFNTWDDFHSWYMALLRNKIQITPGMKTLLAKTIRTEDTPMRKVQSVYRFVASEIRYVGFEAGLGAIQPRSTDTTFHSRMGDCKDVSLLLAAMLRECGIDARLALVRTKERGPADLSSVYIGEFNHALCYVNIDGGFFLDATTPYSGIRELPYDDRALVALVLDEKGYRFINTGLDYYFRESSEFRNDITVSPDGSGHIRRIVKKTGDHAAMGRIRQSKQKKIRNLVEFWNRHFPGADISDFNEINSNIDQPYEYSYTISVPLVTELSKDFMILPSVMPPNDFSGFVQLEKRSFPLILPQPVRINGVDSIRFPATFSVEKLPATESYRNPKFTASYRYSLLKGEIRVEYTITIAADEITPEEYREFRDFVYFISRKERERILFRNVYHHR